ncbi:hypothetical protein DBR40_14775 [Pedobacter sp. KBW01]|nr:hypothetical protein DBR40_14775 [Pedobacter sp. KBW01]
MYNALNLFLLEKLNPGALAPGLKATLVLQKLTIDGANRRTVIARRNDSLSRLIGKAILQRSLVETEVMLFPTHSSKIASYLAMTTLKWAVIYIDFYKIN